MLKKTLASSALLVPALAGAQVTYDTSQAVSDIGAGATAIAAIGVAMLALFILRKVWRMVRP